jgi:hypothetical protein
LDEVAHDTCKGEGGEVGGVGGIYVHDVTTNISGLGIMLHLVTHMMVTEGISITLLKHELIENHDGNHQQPHSVEEMNCSECNLISFGPTSGIDNMMHQCHHVTRKCVPYMK